MRTAAVEPARLPPAGLPGLDPAWSRLVRCADADGVPRTWHVLDSHADADASTAGLTVLAVHGNPTWSYLWRNLVASRPAGVRVVAPDQLDMGYSERTGTVRRLADRVADLGALTSALGITGPVVTVAHDWGGPISLGWALEHQDQLRGVVLLNTAVHQPADSAPPTVIRLARARGLIGAATTGTPLFVRATTALSGRSMPRPVSRAFAAPYGSADRRAGVGTFVADIPFEDDHPSAGALDSIAAGLERLADVPALLMWGPGDPVFSDRYLSDLAARLPHADIHRYEGARHLVSEDAPALVHDVYSWIADLGLRSSARTASAATAEPGSDLGAELARRAKVSPDATALAEPAAGGWRTVTWRQLAGAVDRLARGLVTRGIRPGDRVAVLVKPGADLLATVYACWRIGASVVVTDAGLGVRGIHRALRGASVQHIVAIPQAMALVRATGISGQRIAAADLGRLAELGAGTALPPLPGADAEAAVVFTSGSTGPAKGVVYLHAQVARTVGLLREHYAITDDDSIVAAFAPWAVLGPALGVASVLPDMDVTSPRTLRAEALADAVERVHGTLLWASPAAMASVLSTADALTDRQRKSFDSLRLVLGAGAPVSLRLLRGMRALCPQADVRTPYGMTEALPVADVNLEQIEAAGAGPGVLVGLPLPGVDVRVSALDGHGFATGPLTDEPGVPGEIAVRSDHVKERYDRLWVTQRASARDAGWHRTGDVGTLDDSGRLWIGGRLAHVVASADGPVLPVPVEQRVEERTSVEQAACVGVGPVGGQQVVVVIRSSTARPGVADLDVTNAVRRAAGVPVAAVLVRREMPVDIRHNSKIDRSALAAWATKLLAGRGRS